jgi:hypothetical protein
MPGIKKGKDVTIKGGWEDLFVKPVAKPAGYSTTAEIAEKLGMCTTSVKDRMRKLRKMGKIDAIWVCHNGTWTWAYKD